MLTGGLPESETAGRISASPTWSSEQAKTSRAAPAAVSRSPSAS